ncbi:alpha/beta hydrolase [Candidatus Saccharibacteria bacterium]|nr:alpha/beta hydrolase [Candidatus Saccharibacteria bacterium]MBQ9016733.1 alpha/beta hydrolase [Candidatus Saccharibacteria bacterium]
MTTIYVIHGWTYTVAPWERTIRELREKGIKVEMLNVPGLTTPSNKVWTIEDYVKWADKNIPKDSIVLGHSNGGRILLNLLSEKPEKVKHLILVDAAGVYEESKKRDVSRKVSKTFAPLKRVKLFRKVYHKLLGASDYDRAPENMKQTLSNMLESDKKLDISKVTTPTTILWGQKDTITPPRQAEKMKELLPNAELTFYANWSHAPYISDPSGFARAIAKAVKAIDNVDPARSLAAKTKGAI